MPHPMSRKFLVTMLTVMTFGLLPPRSAWAHGGEELAMDAFWGNWNFTPDIVAVTALVILLYIRGARRRRNGSREGRRHLLFFSGVAAMFLSLQSPIDPMAERLFWMHQVQHLLLRMIGPMLIALAAPQGTLVAGLPQGFSRRVFAPVAWNRSVGGTFRFLIRPEIAFALFLAALYVWQIPRLHNASVLNDAIHYTMHVTMLLAGLLFWFLIFDRRDPPKGISYPVRALMLIGAIVSNILLGAITTLKETVLYTAYDVAGRLFDINPLTDETTGGFVIWIPGSMMCIIAIIVVMHRWGEYERRSNMRRLSWSFSNSRALEWPETAEELRLKVATPNRVTGLVLGATSLSIFIFVFATAVWVHSVA